MLDKIMFWVVLVWMVTLLVMAFWAVREVWREDSRSPDDDAPPSADPTPGRNQSDDGSK
jgi:preprotein translocase subunit SecG